MNCRPIFYTAALVALLGSWFALATQARATDKAGPALAFLRHDNVWLSLPDGSAARPLTHDGTGTRVIAGRQVTYAYLTWSPDGNRLLVGRFYSINQSGQFHQGWSLETWIPGTAVLTPLADNIQGADFSPAWSSDSRRIAYMAASRYNDRTTMFGNTVVTIALSHQQVPLLRYNGREGCLDGSTDPSELLFWTLVGPGGIRQTFLWSSAGHFVIYATECIHTGLTYRDLATGLTRSVGRWSTEAALSPDGRRLVAVDHQRLVLANPDGSDRQVVPGTFGARLPTWSPDGHSIFFVTRRLEHTLHFHDRADGFFTMEVNQTSIVRLDLLSRQLHTVLTRPIHAFANLSVSADGAWLYASQVTNSDALYAQLVHGAGMTADLLNRYGPHSDIIRVPVAGGPAQRVLPDAGAIAVRGG